MIFACWDWTPSIGEAAEEDMARRDGEEKRESEGVEERERVDEWKGRAMEMEMGLMDDV